MIPVRIFRVAGRRQRSIGNALCAILSGPSEARMVWIAWTAHTNKQETVADRALGSNGETDIWLFNNDNIQLLDPQPAVERSHVHAHRPEQTRCPYVAPAASRIGLILRKLRVTRGYRAHIMYIMCIHKYIYIYIYIYIERERERFLYIHISTYLSIYHALSTLERSIAQVAQQHRVQRPVEGPQWLLNMYIWIYIYIYNNDNNNNNNIYIYIYI